VLKHVPGDIGGHCVVPMSHLLDHAITDIVREGLEMLAVGAPFVGDTRMLTQCAKSLLAQTHKDLRVLVVGDGQAPGLRTRDSRVHVYKLPTNRGSYFARAVALAATETPFHGVVDSDDWVDPEWAERLLATGGDAVQ